ncbi:MAG: TonB-dependent hemoglobin/transferrin/lactoferrin family receptor [Gammaproteobacteria bacterium]
MTLKAIPRTVWPGPEVLRVLATAARAVPVSLLLLWTWMLVPAGAAAEEPLGSSQDSSQDSPQDSETVILDPLVTIATRQTQALKDVAGNVTVITRSALDRELSTTLADAFRYTPGIDTTGAGTRFGSDGLVIRGVAGNRVAMLIDGMPVSDQFAVGNFSNAPRDLLDMQLTERIEVLHGPSSSLYGSSALGGVANFLTPDPADLQTAQANTGMRLAQGYAGNDGSRISTAGAAASGEYLSILGMASVRRSHEYDAAASHNPDEQDIERESGLAKLIYQDDAGNELRGTYYGYRDDVDTDIDSLPGSGRFINTTRLHGDDHVDFDLYAAQYRMNSNRWVDSAIVRAYYGSTNVRQNTIDERGLSDPAVRLDRQFNFSQDTSGLGIDLLRSFHTGTVEHRVGVGGEWQEQDLEESRYATELDLDSGQISNTVLGETFPVRDFPRSETRDIGAYVHDEMRLGPVTAIAALRYDHYRLDPRPDAIYQEDNPDSEPVDIRADEFSPKLGLVAPLAHSGTGSLDGWVQYAHGFRAPSFEDANIGLDIPLFNIRAIPNPDLQPETSDGIEAGLRWRGPRSGINLTGFYTRYDDFIESKVRLGPDPESGRILFQSQNIDKAWIYGAELGGEFSLRRWLPGIELRTAAYWARGDNREDDQPLNSVGPAQAVIAVGWSSQDMRNTLTFAGTFTQRYSRLDESRGELFEAPGYACFDLFFDRRLGRRLRLRAGIENLFDKTYWRWANVRGLGPDDPLIPLLSEPGRSIALNAAMNF